MPLNQLAVTASSVTARRPSASAEAHATRETRAAQGARRRRPAAEASSSAVSTSAARSTGAQRDGRPAKTPSATTAAVRRLATPKTREARREGMRGETGVSRRRGAGSRSRSGSGSRGARPAIGVPWPAMSPWRPLMLLLAAGCATTAPRTSDDVIGSSSLRAPDRAIEAPATGYPGDHWERVSSPEAVGFSAPKLDMVRGLLEDLDTTAAMVIVHGRVLFQYGDVERVSYVASIRKSILGMLFGQHIAHGEIAE